MRRRSRATSIPRRRSTNFERLAARRRLKGGYGLLRGHRLHAARRRTSRRAGQTPREPARRRGAHLHGPPPGHDARRARQRAARRGDGRRGSMPTRGCRPPSCCCRSGCHARRAAEPPRPAEESRRALVAAALAAAALPLAAHASTRTRSSSRTARYVTVVTNAGGGASRWRGLAVTRWREDRTRDPGGQFIYLRDVRSGHVWSATYQPTCREPEEYVVTFSSRDARCFAAPTTASRRSSKSSVSAEDDVEVRRLSLTNQSDRTREIEITSYAEIVLGAPGRRRGASRVRQAVHRNRVLAEQLSAALRPAAACRRRSPARGRFTCSASTAGRRRRPSGRRAAHASSGEVARPIGRSRSTAGRCPGRPAPCWIRSSACASACVSAGRLRPAVVCDRRRRRSRNGPALAQKYHDPGAAARAFAMSLHAQPDAAAASGHHERATRGSTTGSLRACLSRRIAARRARRCSARTSSARRACGLTVSPATCPSCSCNVVEDGRPGARATGAAGAGVLAAARVCSADVVILNEHPISYLDEMHEHLAALIESGPWSAWKDRPGGVFLLRGDGLPDADRTLLEAAARAVLVGNRGELSQQLDRPAPTAVGARAATDPAADCLARYRRIRSSSRR